MKSDSYVVPVRLSGFLKVGIILKSLTQTAMHSQKHHSIIARPTSFVERKRLVTSGDFSKWRFDFWRCFWFEFAPHLLWRTFFAGVEARVTWVPSDVNGSNSPKQSDSLHEPLKIKLKVKTAGFWAGRQHEW